MKKFSLILIPFFLISTTAFAAVTPKTAYQLILEGIINGKPVISGTQLNVQTKLCNGLQIPITQNCNSLENPYISSQYQSYFTPTAAKSPQGSSNPLSDLLGSLLGGGMPNLGSGVGSPNSSLGFGGNINIPAAGLQRFASSLSNPTTDVSNAGSLSPNTSLADQTPNGECPTSDGVQWVQRESTTCPQTIGPNPIMKKTLIEACQKVKKPILARTIYRPPNCNTGAAESNHLSGRAIDMYVTNLTPEEQVIVFQTFRKNGFTGTGCYNNRGYIHMSIGSGENYGTGCPLQIGLAGYRVR